MAKRPLEGERPKVQGATPRREGKAPEKRFFKWRESLSRVLQRKRILTRVCWLPLVSLLLGGVLITGWLYWDTVIESVDRDITTIEIRGQLNYLVEKQLQGELNGYLGEGFLSLDLNAVKDSVESMPWVYSASLKRQWPGTLKIYIKEQYPVAVWNKTSYLNEYGEVFEPADRRVIEGVPVLSGPLERAKDVLQRYVAYRDAVEESGAELALLGLEARGAWHLGLENGLVIKLGRDPVDLRLKRFLKVYKRGLGSKAEEIESIDARYTNGIAVRWKPLIESDNKESGDI